jgi:hypothetical protein
MVKTKALKKNKSNTKSKSNTKTKKTETPTKNYVVKNTKIKQLEEHP